MANDFLQSTHPLYAKRTLEWVTNERRIRGGFAVLDELQRFDWETAPGETVRTQENKDIILLNQPGDHYTGRQRRAIYLNFPDFFAATLLGQLMRKAPRPDEGLNFGGLGEVARTGTVPTRAEMVYYNADGVGSDGSQWNSFWTKVGKLAVGTGHRWLMVEASNQRPLTRADELRGLRPYLTSFSPLQGTNWHYEGGRLAFFIQRMQYRAPLYTNGKLEGNDFKVGRRLYVRRGWDGFGSEYVAGGWWEFDDQNAPIEGRSGSWDLTNGEIPIWAHFYERDDDEFSRSGITELGNAAAAWMNLESAASYDAWDAAVSLQFLLGIDPESFKTAMAKVQDGSRFIPVPASQGTMPGQSIVPSVHDTSTGAVVADVFERRLTTIRTAVRDIAGMEAIGEPGSSGDSKEAGFAEKMSPRLAMIASEMEGSQNTAIYFLERRFGVLSPSGSVRWPREFEIVPLVNRLEQFFTLETLSGVRSPTADSKAMAAAAGEAGIITDDAEMEQVKQEYEAAAKDAQDAKDQLRDALINGGGAGTPAGAGAGTGADGES